MTEEIDVKKLTKDAFMAIDAIFTDEDDLFSEVKEKEPDDFDIIQEYMLAIEWECSDKNIKKFSDFLTQITPKYSGKYNQDILKMLVSIVRYLEKSKAKALPETHNVMESIVKNFKAINQNGVGLDRVKQERNDAYNKVLELKSKIAKAKSAPSPSIDDQYQDNASEKYSGSIESSRIIVSILARLEFCENRLSSIEAQNIKLQQQLNEYERLSARIDELDLKYAGQIEELAKTAVTADSMPDLLNDADDLSFDVVSDGSEQFDELSFDGLDFDDMILEDSISVQDNGNVFEEVSLEEVSLDEIEIDAIGIDTIRSDSVSSTEIDFDQIISENMESFPGASSEKIEEITSEDIFYEELTADDLSYDQMQSDDRLENNDESHDLKSLENAELSTPPESGKDDINPGSVKCFKIEDDIVAVPENIIYNVYRIPSKLSSYIHNGTEVDLAQFSTLTQSLSKNMNGYLKDYSGSQLRELKVNVHQLKEKITDYKYAILCSIDGKLSMIPVSDKGLERSVSFNELLTEENDFSEFKVNIDGVGTIPYLSYLAK